MLFFKRKKEKKQINIVNFGKPYWGNDIVLDKVINTKKEICDVHGWHNIYEPLKKDTLVIKKQEDGYWYGRILKIKYCSDPNDMFFATVQTITSRKMLTDEEYKYLEDNKLLNK